MGKVKLLFTERRIIESAVSDGNWEFGEKRIWKEIAVRNRKHLDALLEYVQEEACGVIGKMTLWDIPEIKDNVIDFGVTIDLNFLDVSKVTDMSGLFKDFDISPTPEKDWRYKIRLDISDWDVSNVTKMAHMFDGCGYDFGDLSKWDRSKVTDC